MGFTGRKDDPLRAVWADNWRRANAIGQSRPGHGACPFADVAGLSAAWKIGHASEANEPGDVRHSRFLHYRRAVAKAGRVRGSDKCRLANLTLRRAHHR